MQEKITSQIAETVKVLESVKASASLVKEMNDAVLSIVDTLKNGGKIMIAGNGGSAADAQHISGEFVGRFCFNRPALASLALSTDTTVLTAVGNDYGFDQVFSRQIEAVGLDGDIFMAISTSGKSANVIRALEACKKKNIKTIGMTGLSGGDMLGLCDHMILVPSESTQNIQEAHGVIGHIICMLVESTMFSEK